MPYMAAESVPELNGWAGIWFPQGDIQLHAELIKITAGLTFHILQGKSQRVNASNI